MIDPADDDLPSLLPGFTWVQPKAVGPLTDRLVVQLNDAEVAMVVERNDGDGFFSQVNRQRVMGALDTRRFRTLGAAAAWIARWIELRESGIREEVNRQIQERRAGRTW